MYRLGDSGVPDSKFDALMDEARLIDPTHPIFQEVGSEYGTEVKLPISMGSLNKVRPDELVDWFERTLPKKGSLRTAMLESPLIITPKLDGASVLLEYSPNGKFVRAYSRGNGTLGQDITHAVKFCENFPREVYTFSTRMFVRAEIIVRRSEFQRLQTGLTFNNKGYPYVNARNAIVGCLNAKQKSIFHTETLRVADMIAFSVYFKPEGKQEMPRLPYFDPRATERADIAHKTLQFNFLKKSGFTLPYSGLASGAPGQARYTDNAKEVWAKAMRTTIHNMREKYDYDTDGLVAEIDVPKFHSLGYETNSLNPRWARAVKLDPSEQEARVIEVASVNWQRTARGIYKPIVALKYEAIFQGVRVRNIYVDNARWVRKNKVGPGAYVAVIRSGDVIPRIIEVTKRADEKIKLPKKCHKHKEKLVWTETKTDLYCPVCSGEMNSPPEFFKQLAPDNVGETLVSHVCDQLNLTTILEVLNTKPPRLSSIEKFGSKRAKDFHSAIHRAVEQASLAKLMHCSGAFRSPSFGLGETRLQSILDEFTPEYLMGRDHSSEALYERARLIDGIGSRAARCFADQFVYFKHLFEDIEGFCYAAHEEAAGVKNTDGVLNNMKFVFTGFRNKEMEMLIKREGGKIAGSVSKGVDTVFVADGTTVKAKRATQLGIPVVVSADAEKFITGIVKKRRKKAGLPLDQIGISSKRKKKSMDRNS